MRKRLTVVLAMCCMMLLSGVGPALAADALVLGVHPYKPAQELFKMFKPVADYVSQKIGRPVELQIAKTYEDAAEKLGNGQFSFSFVSPTVYAKYSNQYQYKPLCQIVNKGKPVFSGVLVAKKGGGISTIKDLKGKSFAFGDRNSTLTHVVPLYMLMNEGIHLGDLKKNAFVGSHDNVALAVVNGAFDAAGLMPDIAAKYADQGLEVIAKSPDLPEHVFAATKGMDDATASKIQAALLGMDATVYKGIKDSLTGLQKFNDKDFDVLRRILSKVEKDLDK